MAPIVLTLSRFPDIFERLLLSLEKHEPYLDLVLAQDGDDPGFLEFRDTREMAIFHGEQPFVFARNVNRVLKEWRYQNRDVLLVNDDVELVMPILDALQTFCNDHPQIGLLSPQIDGGVGNAAQRVNWSEARWIESAERLAFVCVYIPAKTRNLVGVLDERLTGYGSEDTNYCRRVQAAGLSWPDAAVKPSTATAPTACRRPSTASWAGGPQQVDGRNVPTGKDSTLMHLLRKGSLSS